MLPFGFMNLLLFCIPKSLPVSLDSRVPTWRPGSSPPVNCPADWNPWSNWFQCSCQAAKNRTQMNTHPPGWKIHCSYLPSYVLPSSPLSHYFSLSSSSSSFLSSSDHYSASSHFASGTLVVLADPLSAAVGVLLSLLFCGYFFMAPMRLWFLSRLTSHLTGKSSLRWPY